MPRRLIASVAVAAAVAAICVKGAAGTVPRLSVWYRGQPPGTARAADLAALRAEGFTAIVWPTAQTVGQADAARLALDAGLEFIERPAPVPLTPAMARHPGATVDIAVAAVPLPAISPLVWRAIAHGARDVSFDVGVGGAGRLPSRGAEPLWAPAVGEISRQIRINGKLFEPASAAPDQPVIDAPIPKAVDVVLLSAGRTWVLVATNTAGTRARVTAHLPAPVPYAIWLNLLNGGTLAMLSEPRGPRWRFDLEAWGTRIYVIDKVLK